MTDFQIRIMAFVVLVAAIELLCCIWLYDWGKKQQTRAEYWRSIAKEQADNPLFEIYMISGERVSRDEYLFHVREQENGS